MTMGNKVFKMVGHQEVEVLAIFLKCSEVEVKKEIQDQKKENQDLFNLK